MSEGKFLYSTAYELKRKVQDLIVNDNSRDNIYEVEENQRSVHLYQRAEYGLWKSAAFFEVLY